MTTIVYDYKTKQIACDSRVNAGGVIMNDSAEKFRYKGDEIWFFCGNTADEEHLMSLSHNDKLDAWIDCNALYVKNNTCFLVTFEDDYCKHTELSYSHSIGSGWKFALSALDFNCNAENAVMYAAKKDIYTGGKIRVYDIEKAEFL